jgi:putative peptidoglycan lipid II flippase
MVSKILKFFNRESQGINEAALLLGLFTFSSQILGLVRDRLLATYLGATGHLDVYYAAFRIPDLLYVSLATLASITVILPFLNQRFTSSDTSAHEETRRFIDQIFTVLLFFLVGVSILLFILMPWLSHVIAPGFSAADRASLVMLSRIMLAQPILVGISNMFSSVSQMLKKFLVTALSPIFYNIGIISGIVIGYPLLGITGLAWGVVLGACLHLGVQIPVLIKHGLTPRITASLRWDEIAAIVKTSLPRTLGLSFSSICMAVLISMASRLQQGSITLLSLTSNIFSVPVGIIGVSYAVASFPSLVKAFQSQDDATFNDHIFHTLRKIVFFMVPVVVLFIVLRAQIIRVILGSQSFSWDNTRLAAAMIAILSLALVAQSIIHVFIRGYYAMGNTRKPLLTNIASEGLGLLSATGFLWLFRHVPAWHHLFQSALRLENISSLDILALPLAYVLGNTLNALLLWKFMMKDRRLQIPFAFVRTTIHTLIAAIGMGAVTYGFLNILVIVIKQSTFWGIFFQGLIAGIFGLTIFTTILLLVHNEDMEELLTTLKRKFWKQSVIQEPDQNLNV